MQSGWRLAQQNSAFIENSFTTYRIQDLDFYQVFFIDKQWWKKKKCYSYDSWFTELF